MVLKRLSDKYYINREFYINKVNKGVSATKHTHDFLEIVYVFSGRAVHYIDGEAYPLTAGDALFINFGSTHRFDVINKNSYADVIIKPDYINEKMKGAQNAFALLELDDFKGFVKIVDRNSKVLHFVGNERKQVENLIKLSYLEQSCDNPGKELVLHSLFNTLMTFVFRKMALPMKNEMTLSDELLGYIKHNCAKPLTLEGLALANHYNPAYFSRLFKKTVGCTFTEYVVRCRIELACELLQNTDLKVGEVAEETGYSNHTKFYKDFFNVVGTTPHKYRKSKN